MAAILVSAGAAADAVMRIPKTCWIGHQDSANDYPGFGAHVVQDGEVEGAGGDKVPAYRGVGEDEAPTHVMWDGTFGEATRALIEAVAAHPERIPSDASGLTRAALRALYPEVTVDPDPEVVVVPPSDVDGKVSAAAAVLAEAAELPVVTVPALVDILNRTAEALGG